MNVVRKVLSALGGICFTALLFAAVAPRAARGVAAALVQVTNTTANPVPIIAAAATNSFDAIANCQFQPSDNGHNDFCLADPIYTVPSGKIAVVEHASGRCILDQNVGLREARLTTTAGQASFFVASAPVFFPVQNSISSFAQETKTYVAAGVGINMEMFSSQFQTDPFDSCVLDVSGYLVSQ